MCIHRAYTVHTHLHVRLAVLAAVVLELSDRAPARQEPARFVLVCLCVCSTHARAAHGYRTLQQSLAWGGKGEVWQSTLKLRMRAGATKSDNLVEPILLPVTVQCARMCTHVMQRPPGFEGRRPSITA